MKQVGSLLTFVVFIGLMIGSNTSITVSGQSTTAGQGSKTPPDVIELSTAAKLGKVRFNHTNHITKNHNIEGAKPIACIECHHVEQPASEVAKNTGMKTAWPADRTTTLTAELLKDPSGPNVIGCRNCHARTGENPTILPAIPEMKSENSTAVITLNNQQAFHRTCGGCHDQAAKTRADVKAPTSTKCTACHKK